MLKFDHEITSFQEKFEIEKASHETSQRERDKYCSEKNNMQSVLDEKDDEISQLRRKVASLEEEISDAGKTGKSDTDMVVARRQNRELEAKLQDQEDELDEQAGKIQQLEQAKTRLEMASMREKQNVQRDLDAKEEEIEQIKLDHVRKIRALEEQVEEETKRKDEVTKAKRDLEHKVFDLEASVDEVNDKGTERKLRKELKRIKILYKDAKGALDCQPQKTEQGDLKALRNQLEDAEYAKHVALKAKSQIEGDLEEVRSQIESITQGKEASDNKCIAIQRGSEDFQARIEELEDEMEDVIRNNKQLITQLSEARNNVINIKESNKTFEEENICLVEKVNLLTKKLEMAENNKVEKTEVERLEVKIVELETRGENDAAARIKQEHLLNRVKSQLERAQDEINHLQDSQTTQTGSSSKFERMLKDCRNELENVKSQEAAHKRKKEDAENEVHNLEDELSKKRAEINTMTKRIRELQNALEHGAGSSDDDDSLPDDVGESDDSYSSFKRQSSITRQRRPLSKRTNTTDIPSYSSTASSYRTQRRLSNDDTYIPSSNGYLSREGSRDSGDPLSSYTSAYSRKSTRLISRQDSFE